MHIQTVIEQLGYQPSQVRIYLAALKMGETTISDLADKVGMPRTTVTQIASQMQHMGLLNTYAKRGKKYWLAENPDKLLITLREREAALQTILPSLHNLRGDSSANKPTIKVYEGQNDLKLIFNDIITAHHHILGTVSWDDVIDLMGQDFLDDFIERRFKNFLQIRLITPRSETAMALKTLDQKQLRHTRFLPQHIQLRRISSFIYGDKVALISLNKKVPTGTVIEDPDIVHAMTIYFESLWLHCSEK